MNDKWTSETKGLLLIPFGSDAMEELQDKYIREGIKYTRINQTKRDLNNSIKEYLNKEYVNKERE